MARNGTYTGVEAKGSGPFFTGTLIFIILWAIAVGVSYAVTKAKRNNYFGLSLIICSMSAVCMWMMWGTTWLMQWHPLIVPEEDL